MTAASFDVLFFVECASVRRRRRQRLQFAGVTLARHLRMAAWRQDLSAIACFSLLLLALIVVEAHYRCAFQIIYCNCFSCGIGVILSYTACQGGIL